MERLPGWAAGRLLGANFFDGLERDGVTRLPVPLNFGAHGNGRGDEQVRICFHGLETADQAPRYGIPAVTPARATYDAIRLVDDWRESVVAIDMMAAAELVSLRMVREYADRQRGRDHRVAWALDLATEHSRSPNETRLRLLWLLDAKLPRPLVNCPVYDRTGRCLGIADLLEAEAGLVVEFDGTEHRRAGRQTADVQKEDRLRRVGLEVTRVTGMELSDRSAVVRRLHAARCRARLLSPAERLWVPRSPADDLHQRILEREHLAGLHERLSAEPLPDIRELRGY
ncbi:MAG: hypothetical protein JWR85_2256 [Marmoricola sp.]|nr:hypothetical protein [Marmoricola sp.]